MEITQFKRLGLDTCQTLIFSVCCIHLFRFLLFFPLLLSFLSFFCVCLFHVIQSQESHVPCATESSMTLLRQIRDKIIHAALWGKIENQWGKKSLECQWLSRDVKGMWRGSKRLGRNSHSDNMNLVLTL